MTPRTSAGRSRRGSEYRRAMPASCDGCDRGDTQQLEIYFG
jgi:hypothetical protein